MFKVALSLSLSHLTLLSMEVEERFVFDLIERDLRLRRDSEFLGWLDIQDGIFCMYNI